MTSFQDFIVKPGSPNAGALLPRTQLEFMRRRLPEAFSPLTQSRARSLEDSSKSDQISKNDVLIRLPSISKSKSRVTLLQRWVGRVERLDGNHMIAVLDDETNPKNPLEEVELDLSEVSASDLPLLTVGATFYWSIGYRDSLGGQRERTSMLRFARVPRPNEKQIKRAFEEADELATFLESA